MKMSCPTEMFKAYCFKIKKPLTSVGRLDDYEATYKKQQQLLQFAYLNCHFFKKTTNDLKSQAGFDL